MSDESFPDLDLDSSQEQEEVFRSVEETDRSQHLLGLPPPSDYSSSEASIKFETDTYLSSDNELNVDSYPAANGRNETESERSSSPESEPEPLELEPERMPNLLIDPAASDGRNDDDASASTNEPDSNTEDFMKLFLSSSLLSMPLKLRDGFTPDEIDRCLGETMSIGIYGAARVLLPMTVLQALPNNSKTEVAHALRDNGWLKIQNGKFFPVVDDAQQRMVEEMVLGAELNDRREEKKKQEAESYPNVESEIKAMVTFNMIVQLMHAVMDERKQSAIQYTSISSAYEKMVRQEGYMRIYILYAPKLNFSPDERWNHEWFKAYTNRSSLKKFVLMSKFSQIQAQHNCTFTFRDPENVQLFKDADIEAVRKQWEHGNSGNRGRRSGPPHAARKKEVAGDPNYQSATLSTGLEDDDGSVQPTTSWRNNARNGSSSQPSAPSFGRQNCGERPGSPAREFRNDRSTERQDSRRRSTSRNRRDSRSPPRPNNYRAPNPFGGGGGRNSGRDGFGGGRGGDGFEDRPSNRRVEEFGDTSSESEQTSEGEYTDESDGAKEKRLERRKTAKRRKEEKHENRKNRTPKEPIVTNNYNRFTESSFKSNEAPSSSQNRSRRASPAREASPSRNAPRRGSESSGSTTPIPVQTRRRSERKVSPGPPDPSRSSPPVVVPLHISSSTHTAPVPILPHRAAPHQVAENERKKREEAHRNERRAAAAALQRDSGNHGTNERTNSQPTHPGLAPRQPRQNPPHEQDFKEPSRGAGFGARRNNGENIPPTRQPEYDDHQNRRREEYYQPPPNNNSGYRGQDQFWQRSPSPPRQRYPDQQNCNRQRHPPPEPYNGHSSHQYDSQYERPLPQQQQQHYGQPHSQQHSQQYSQQDAPAPPRQYTPNHSSSQQYPPFSSQPAQPCYPPRQEQSYQNHPYPPRDSWQSNQNCGGSHGDPHYRGLAPTYTVNDNRGYSLRTGGGFEQSRPPPPHIYQYPNVNGPSGNYSHQPPHDPYGPSSSSYPLNQASHQHHVEPYVLTPASSAQVIRPNSTISLPGRLHNAVRMNQGNPNGPLLIAEAIKLEINNYLRHQRDRGETVFESHLQGMVYRLKKDSPMIQDDFNITEFIINNMQSVETYYNPGKQELEFHCLI